MDVDAGAAKYYSSNSDFKTDKQKYVPDAKGYPFIQKEYKVKNREISKYFIGIMRGKYVGRVEGGFPQQ